MHLVFTYFEIRITKLFYKLITDAQLQTDKDQEQFH